MVIRKSGDTDKANARVAQLVERDLAKVEAAGSSPVSRFFYAPDFKYSGAFIFRKL